MDNADSGQHDDTPGTQTLNVVAQIAVEKLPSQLDATPGTQPPTPTATQVAASLGLFDDETAAAIHDAFLMGWSIPELKSRVVLKALNLEADASASDSTLERVLATNGSVATTSGSSFNMVDTLLKKSLQSTPDTPLPSQDMPIQLNNSISDMSEWRAIFNRIATVHSKSFPTSTTRSTPYDPSPTSPVQSRFPYLYPNTSPDYGLIGIGKFGSFGLTDLDTQEKLGNFVLYDTTRRALNCLTLLHTEPEESLIPDIMSAYQTQIVQAILNEVLAASQNDPNDTSPELSRHTRNQAIKVLTSLTVLFLESWDGYLRENFYAGGRLKDSELELIAYQAGSALASLSWGISLMTFRLENALQQDPNSTQQLTQLASIWMSVFNSHSINNIQRLISSFGPALDDAYYRIYTTVQRPAASERLSPDLPSYAINVVTHSLDYWRRAVQWACQPPPAGTTITSTTTEVAFETTTTSGALTTEAAIETSTTSATINTTPSNGEANAIALTFELSQHMRQTLINQADIWQSLLLCEQNLRSFRTESVAKSILNTILKDFEQSAKSAVLAPAEKRLKRYLVPMIVVGVLLLVILGGGIFLLARTNQLQSLTAVITFLVGSALTLVSTLVTRESFSFSSQLQQSSATNATQDSTRRVEQHASMFSLAGEAMGRAFQNAYKEMQGEFEELNHHIAVSYPLIDFFIMYSPKMQVEIQDSYVFLTKIIWTREEQREEIERVARAAFGSLGTIVSPQSLFSHTENGASSTPYSQIS